MRRRYEVAIAYRFELERSETEKKTQIKKQNYYNPKQSIRIHEPRQRATRIYEPREREDRKIP